MENASGKKSKKSSKSLKEVNTEEDKLAALSCTIANIEKAYGKGAIMKLGDKSKTHDIPVLPTGSLNLDIALGVGGIPKGRIIEVFGPEASGKTTIALHMVAESQKQGGICGYIDAEHALDPVYAKRLGVNIDELYISQPDDGEQALEIAEAMVRSSAIDLIIIDSVAALTPRAEIEGNMGDSHMGLQARLMSQALRKITAFANKTSCTVIFINQLRDKIGGTGGYGGPNETTTGGRALKFYASVRLDIRRFETLKIGDTPIGNKTKVKVAKNKVAPPFKVCFFDIIYGQGISREGEILDLAVELDLVVKSGAWYSYNDERLGQGRENAKMFLKEHEEIMEKLEHTLKVHFGIISEKEEEPEENKKKQAKKADKKSNNKTSEEEISIKEIEDIEMEELDLEQFDVKNYESEELEAIEEVIEFDVEAIYDED